MKKKAAAIVSITVLMSSLSFGTAFAFTDVDSSQAEAVTTLQNQGVADGMDADHFMPRDKLTYAQGVQLLVRAFHYNMDTMRFAHMPAASELFPHVQNNAWFANAFIVAHYNGLDIPEDVDPNAALTREQFASLLDKAFEHVAKLPMINIKLQLKDEADVTPSYQGSILRLVHYKIAELDKDGSFHPKDEITRGESAVWIYNALQYIADAKAHEQTKAESPQIDK